MKRIYIVLSVKYDEKTGSVLSSVPYKSFTDLKRAQQTQEYLRAIWRDSDKYEFLVSPCDLV